MHIVKVDTEHVRGFPVFGHVVAGAGPGKLPVFLHRARIYSTICGRTFSLKLSFVVC